MSRRAAAHRTHVPVYHTPLLVQVLERLGDLHDHMPRQLLAKIGEPHDLVEELAAGGQLEDNVVVLFGLGEVDELDDVGMVDLAHYLHLLKDIGALQGRGPCQLTKVVNRKAGHGAIFHRHT